MSAHAAGLPRWEHYPQEVEIKGATCTTLRVVLEDGRWIAQTVVDV